MQVYKEAIYKGGPVGICHRCWTPYEMEVKTCPHCIVEPTPVICQCDECLSRWNDTLEERNGWIANREAIKEGLDSLSGCAKIAQFGYAAGLCSLRDAVLLSHCSTGIFFEDRAIMIDVFKRMMKEEKHISDCELFADWNDFKTEGSEEDYVI